MKIQNENSGNMYSGLLQQNLDLPVIIGNPVIEL